MKNYFYSLVLMLMMPAMGSHSVCYAQWTHTNGPNGAQVNCFVSSGNLLFAGTTYGVVMSADSGNYWTEVNTTIFNQEVRSMVFKGTDLYAGTYSGGVFKSVNYGASWTPAGLTNKHVKALAVQNGNIFAGTMNGAGMYISTDDGASWTSINTGLTDLTILSLAVIGGNIYAGTNTKGVFVSDDSGANWTATNNGLGNNTVRGLTVSGTTMYAATPLGVYVTDDYGANWNTINNGLLNQSIYSVAVTQNGLFAGSMTTSGVFFSSNAGASWSALNTGLTNFTVPALTGLGHYVFAGSENGIFRRQQNDTSWRDVGLPCMDVYAMAKQDSSLYAVAYTGCVYGTVDSGQTWKQYTNGISNHIIKAVGAADGYLYEGGILTGVYVSADHGATWNPANNGLATTNIRTFAVNGNLVFVGTTQGIYVTSDHGASWTPLTNGLNKEVLSIVLIGGSIFAATYQDGVYVSTDNGTSWTQVNNGLTNHHVYALAVIGTSLFAGTSGAGVFVSNDNGANWSPASTGLQPYVSSLAVSGTTLFAGTDSCRVYMSNNYGASWINVSQGLNLLPPRPTACLLIKDNMLYAGILSHSVWKRPLTDIMTGLQPGEEVDGAVSVNYPNPFATTTQIRFHVYTKGKVKIEVYDILGNTLKVLVNRHFVTGDYEAGFDGSAFVPGVYFYRIISGEMTETRRMVISR